MRAPPPPYAGEGPHALWHVSEDPSLGVLHPRHGATASPEEKLVWAVDTRHLPMFWFPRDCPRATFWAGAASSAADIERFLDGVPQRVHAIESRWLSRMRGASVVGYRVPEEPFEPHREVGGYWVARSPVEPVERVELGDLLERHAEAQIELRIVPNLWPLWSRVIESSLEFSGIRLRNAEPPAPGHGPGVARPA